MALVALVYAVAAAPLLAGAFPRIQRLVVGLRPSVDACFDCVFGVPAWLSPGGAARYQHTCGFIPRSRFARTSPRRRRPAA